MGNKNNPAKSKNSADQSVSGNTPVANTPIALTIAGSDSGGGAGIQADLKTFSALGAYGASVITALTAQNTQTVSAIHEVPPAFITEQLNCVLSDLTVTAIKVGMLASPDIIRAVADVLEQHRIIPVVLDPVMVAKSGDSLLSDDALGALKERLCPLATVITPNLPEAAKLLACDEAINEEQVREQARELIDTGIAAVLVKGGHLSGQMSTDILISSDSTVEFPHTRIDTKNTHGTGCTLSSAIAAGLAKGCNLEEAVANAQSYVHEAICAADELQIGHGHGPVHHFHAFWPRQ